MLSVVVTAALLGLSSAPHCALMCGPLVASTCRTGGRSGAQLVRYILARTVSYALVGAGVAAIGRPFIPASWAFGIQVAAASLVAATILVRATRLLEKPRNTASAPVQVRVRRRPSLAMRAFARLPRGGLA